MAIPSPVTEGLLKQYIFKDFIYLLIFREGGREGEREGERNQRVVACCVPTVGDLAHNPGMYPDWESNQ